MKYKCDKCNYETDNKSNFNKHTKSKTHSKLISDNKTLTDDFNKKILHNCSCGKSFSHISSLSRHKKTCTGTNVANEIKQLKEQLDILNHRLQEYSQNSRITTNNTYISVKNHINFIKENYSQAPPLKQLEDYTIIDDNKLLDNIVYYFNHSSLDQYLGDFLIKYYKKDNSNEQSIWNSDVSRVTYIIKELLANKKSIWNHDYKGVKTKEYIITPLLNYIQSCIKNYLANFKFDKDTSVKECEKIVERQLSLGQIMQYIDADLAENIIKYIAPHFHLNKYNNSLVDDILLIDN